MELLPFTQAFTTEIGVGACQNSGGIVTGFHPSSISATYLKSGVLKLLRVKQADRYFLKRGFGNF